MSLVFRPCDELGWLQVTPVTSRDPALRIKYVQKMNK